MTPTRSDYTADEVEAAKAVLLEITYLLSEYQGEIVLVGGWVPGLLLSASQIPHVGSTDVDLALNHAKLQAGGYRTIRRLLLKQGYRPDKEQPFIFYRTVKMSHRDIEVEVDLLAGEYGGTGRSHRTQKAQGVQPRKARGCDLAFTLYSEVIVDGVLPGGGRDTVRVRVASIVPFLVMKGMALHSRLEEKDAYDVYFCVANYPGGLDALANEFLPHIDHGLVREGLTKISSKFATPEHIGPKYVADFDEITDEEERAIRQRDAFERVDHLLRRVGIVK